MPLLKFTAYWFTRSSASSLRPSFKPADASHPYGHAKISFFSAGVEGALRRCQLDEWPGSENLGFGTALTALAVAVNGTLGAYLIRAGRRRDSLILIANGKHVLTIAGRAWGS